ncbi:MAG: peptide chain release factor N(5)-glutamine methyltransferase [Fimbriimonadales bacterium]
MTVREFVAHAQSCLETAGVESPLLEARLIAAHVMGWTKEQVFLDADEPFTDVSANQLLERRATGEPLAYVLGRKEFFGREFVVDQSVLIPRPETELLVEAALQFAPEGGSVLDVGTGSGIIAITMSLEGEGLSCVGSDVSEAALRIARTNNTRLLGKAKFVRCDALRALRPQCVDMIVSNPPYVSPSDDRLESTVRDWEPHLALFSEGGTQFIQELVGGAKTALFPGGWLCFEFGHDQEQFVTDCFQNWSEVKIIKDLAGIPRIACAMKAGE